MPGQVFQVVQCYSCHTFQVQQRKKVYGEGSGADCRVHVQKLNTFRGELDHSQQLVMHYTSQREHELGHLDLGHPDPQPREENRLTSRWGQFIDDNDPHTEDGGDDDDDNNDHRWTTDSKMYRESMKRSMKRKKQQTGTFSSQHSLKGDNPFPSTYTNHSWDAYNSHMEHRERENVTGDELYHKFKSPDGNNCQRLQNSSCKTARLCSESVKVVMPSVSKKQKTSDQADAVNSKWSCFIDNEESEDSDSSESTMRLEKSDLNTEYDSLSSLADGQGASVFLDGLPAEPSSSQEDSCNTEASNSTLRSYGNVTGASMTCYHGDDVIGQSRHRKLSPGDSNGQRLAKSWDNNQSGPEHQRANTDRRGHVHVEGKQNQPHKQTSSIFSVGDVDDADLELDF
ncbi:uncharacterized protein [Haliotis asinina]|uniref:uncharacterized protein isoform X2 n=1 Tax=Haliotis asinina TaxID=109174 RepID=UPI003531D3BA